MLTKLLIMRPGEPDETREVELPEEPTYPQLRELITPLLDGGTLERVRVYMGCRPYLGEHYYRDMFVDEEGRATLFRLADDGVTAVRDRPGKNLPRNEAATEIYLRNWRMHEPDQPDDPDYFIAGPAVLFIDRKVWF
jgi:hypothetical protein